MSDHDAPSLFEAYVVDANVILNFWIISEDEPFGKDVHVSAWAYFEEQIEADRIVSPLYVKQEILKHGPPEIKKWITEHEKMFIPVQDELKAPLAAISKQHPIYKTTNGSVADASVIALAKARNLCVITSEKRENDGNRSSRNPKIPNVCEDFDVDWVSVTGFFRREKRSF